MAAGKDKRREEGKESAAVRAAPRGQRPFKGADPSGAGGAPAPSQVVSPSRGPPRGGAARPTCCPGGEGARCVWGGWAAPHGPGGERDNRGDGDQGTRWRGGTSMRTFGVAFKRFGKNFRSFCEQVVEVFPQRFRRKLCAGTRSLRLLNHQV